MVLASVRPFFDFALEVLEMTPFAYGLATLAALWAMGGGNMELFWQRQIWLAIILLILGVNVVLAQKRMRIFKINSASLMLGAGSALAAAIPVVALIWIGRHIDSSSIPYFKESLYQIHPPGLLAVLVGSIFLATGHEIISRGILAPEFGIPGIAFLDALAIGFGLQQVLPFFLFWIMGYFWGFLSRQFGFMTALVSHVLWSLITLSALCWL